MEIPYPDGIVENSYAATGTKQASKSKTGQVCVKLIDWVDAAVGASVAAIGKTSATAHDLRVVIAPNE